jgi:hypothetical protein
MNSRMLEKDFLIPSARDFEPVFALAALLGDPVGFKARLAELAEKSAQAQALIETARKADEDLDNKMADHAAKIERELADHAERLEISGNNHAKQMKASRD